MKCPRCGVEIAEDKLAMPNRCPDWRCPTMPDEVRWKEPSGLVLTEENFEKIWGAIRSALLEREDQ